VALMRNLFPGEVDSIHSIHPGMVICSLESRIIVVAHVRMWIPGRNT